MPYFNTRDIAAIALCASLWGVLNSLISPIFWQMTHLPLLCDLIGFTVLAITVWWVRKLGSATAVGLIATAINFILVPAGTQFLGFMAASIVFDVAARLVGYNAFQKPLQSVVTLIPISTLSAAVAGYLIGTFFMVAPDLARSGGVLGWAGLHAVGGIIGGAIGVVLINSLRTRRVVASTIQVKAQ